VPFAHVAPDALHVGSTLQMHMAAPALPPPVQLWLAPQGCAAPHAPAVEQVSIPPEHCVAPGLQTPWHIPIEHAWFPHEVTVELQWPVASQV
jgi:hypothetical protein